jgi:hypothetical protein
LLSRAKNLIPTLGLEVIVTLPVHIEQLVNRWLGSGIELEACVQDSLVGVSNFR